MELRGIDVSKFNYIWNYDLVAKECDFVILRAGGSDNGPDQKGFYKDGTFEQKYDQLKRRGVPLGAYYVVGKRFLTEADGVIHAKQFLSIIRGKEFEFPLFLDLEVPDRGMNKFVTDASISFCTTIEKAGYYVSIYASDVSGFKDRLTLSRLKDFDRWVASYGSKPKYVDIYGIWQYTSKGRIEGVQGDVDIDIAYRDYPSIIRKAGLNHLK